MIRKKVNKILAIALSASFIAQVAMPARTIFAIETKNELKIGNNIGNMGSIKTTPYIQNFDNGDISGWKKIWGGGSVSALEGGLSVKGANAFGSADGKSFTLVLDNNSPIVKDGQIETDLKVKSHAGRMALVFRYVDEKNYEAVGYDVGNTWVYIRSTDGSEKTTQITTTGPSLAQDSNHKIKLEFSGENLKLAVDGASIYEGNMLTSNKEGKIGFRGWGYDGNYSHGIYDNLVLSQYKEVDITPKNEYISYTQAGQNDINITLSDTTNELEALKVKNEELVRDVDYVVNDNVITIKKEYIEKVKMNGETNIELVFRDGFKTSFKLQIQLPPEEQIDYVNDFSKNGIEGMEVVVGNANISSENDILKINPTSNAIVLDQNSPELYNSEVEFVVNPANDNGNFGVVLRYAGEESWTYIGQDGGSSEWGSDWYVLNSSGARRSLVKDSARIYNRRVKPYKVKVKVVDKVVSIYLDEAEIFNGVVNELTGEKGKTGIRYHGNAGGSINYLSVSTQRAIEPVEGINYEEVEINSETLKVNMDDKFPRVIKYELKSNNKNLYGQETQNYYVDINTKRYKPSVTSEFTDDTAIYHMVIEELGVTFDVVYKIEGNVLNMNITNINDENNTIYTINFPENSLVSARSNQVNAKLTAQNHTGKVDRDLTIEERDETYKTTTIAVLNTNELAASITNSNIKANNEVVYKTSKINDEYSSTGLWTNEYMYKGMLDGKVIAEPWAKVVITDDRNKDNKVDYFDGAIAYRDDIREERFGSEIVRNSYSSVAMNVGSVAQYPFLRILDNVKKFNLGTDGFGQNIIIKGYQTEGHDASHPDFANINKRAGGEEDFRTLLEESEKYNANIGIHINHTEAYPEAKQYGPQLVSDTGGWSWYDSAKQIIRENDILNEEDGMGKRLEELAEKAPGIDMVYVDVYSDERWPAHKLTSKLNELGWAIGSEYGQALPQQSVWTHQLKSNYNSTGDLLHFVNHQEQELFLSSNLFRGPKDAYRSTNGFNGWQGASDYNNTIKDFYTNFLPNKYLMNFPMSQWEDANKAVLGKNNEVVTTYENNKNTITKDGKVIADGNKLFIPWNPETEDKIYHWTDVDGSTTWDLPNSWSDLENVVLYKVTDEGKTEKTLVDVKNGQVKLNTKANTAYVVYKEELEESKDMEWSKGSIVKDMGFDSHTWDYAWSKSSTAENTDHINFVDNTKGNTHIRVNGNNGADATITQKLTGLEGGQTYSASAWMEVSQGRKSEIVVSTPDEKVVSNYTDRSNVIYGSTHSDKLNTYYQRVKMTFTQPEGETTAEIKFNIEEGGENSWVNIDDVRIVPIGLTEQGDHYFFEDFENVDQEYGPFVSTKSDNSHLSEANAPYTSDTIDGKYSMKIRSGDYMRTLPHRIRFKANTTYKVGLSHLSYVDNAFTLGVKSDKAREAQDTSNATLISKSVSKNGNIEVEFTTGNYDDYYIDITKNQGSEYILDNLYVDEVNNISKEELQKLYDDNKDNKDNYYVAEAWTEFTTSLENTKIVLENSTSTQEEIDNAKTILEISISKLKTCNLNGNDKMDIGDLSLVSKYYGKTSVNSGELWDKIKAYDINNDDKIDTNDINIIIDKITN